MRVLFDGFWWVEGPGANRTVMREILSAWHAQFPDDDLCIAVRASHEDRAEDIPDGVGIVTTRLWPQAVSNAVELPVLARRVGADLMVAHNYAPMWGNSTVFVHDLMFLEHPEWFSLPERIYLRPMPWTLRRATAVATSSATEAARIRRLAPYAPPAEPVGLAVTTALTRVEPTRPASAPPGNFSLVVGRLNVRKNLLRAIEAADRSVSISPDQPLLVVGDTAHSGKSTNWDRTAQKLVDRGTVVFLGHVSDSELRWLYEHAVLTICISLDEGFGLPPLEAASFGCPVVVSDIPVFREILGAVGTVVDPLDLDDVVRGIEQVSAIGSRLPAGDVESLNSRFRWVSTAGKLRNATSHGVNKDR